jgi:hypothetical protein
MAFIVLLALIVPLWKICGRAGFHPAWSLLAIIPIFGLLAIAGFLAFAVENVLARSELKITVANLTNKMLHFSASSL